jgi:Ni/Co efflux regulator RcnB
MKRLLSAALAATMVAGLAGAAVAQDRDHHDNGPVAAGHHQDWRKGGRVDHDEWSRGQRVDYRSHHLRKPPRGYEWRNVDGDYVLGAIATGVIADMLLNHH